MNQNTFRDKVIFILAAIFLNFRVNIIGSISLTELFIVTQIPHLFKWFYSQGRLVPYLHKVVIGFVILIAVQCVAEFMVGNSLINAAKGIAVTVMTIFIMLFFLERLIKDISLLIWIPLCKVAGLLIFGDQFGFADEGETTFFKFYIAPIVINLTCIAMLYKNRWISKNLVTICLISSLFTIIGGARSLGFSMFLTVMFYIVYSRYKTMNFKRLLSGLLVVIVILQLFLTFIYMPKVKAGEWGSAQNRQQFESINWNSNIFMVLFSARSDFFVSMVAFMDKPLWGHGSWTVDKTRKYHLLQAKMTGFKYVKQRDTVAYVPNHSVVLSKGVSNGIFAFSIFLWIFITIYKVGYKGLFQNSPFNFYLIWTLVSSFQHLMFGPPAILKNNGAIAFAVIFAIIYLKFIYYLNQLNVNEEETIGSHCYLQA